METIHPSNPPGALPSHDPDPSTVLDAISLDHRKNYSTDPTNAETFITGISLRAAVKPDKFLTLFVSIPYLGIGAKISRSGSRTLPQYRLRRPPTIPRLDTTDTILVHQTWFLVFDNGLTPPPPPPLHFPQKRVGY